MYTLLFGAPIVRPLPAMLQGHQPFLYASPGAAWLELVQPPKEQ